MNTQRKRVKDIITTGVNEAEYWRLYRERSTADRVAAASQMGVLDQKWAKDMYDALRNPATRRAYSSCLFSLMMGFGGYVIAYSLIRAIL